MNAVTNIWVPLRKIHELLLKRDISLNMAISYAEKVDELKRDAAASYKSAEFEAKTHADVHSGTYVMRNGDVLEIGPSPDYAVSLTKGEREPAQD